MDREKDISKSQTLVLVSAEKIENQLCMYVGFACVLFALRLLSIPEDKEEVRSELRQKRLQLSGLLPWRVHREQGHAKYKFELLLHKLEAAKTETQELKRIRSEDAKANEKVVGIFAMREQGWLNERKKLQKHIEILMNQLRMVEKMKDAALSETNVKLKEMEILVESKDKVLMAEQQKLRELEEKLSRAEEVAEELRESAKLEAKEHSSELWKHKTAFMELVSNQRQLKAEMTRMLRREEATKQELESVLEQKQNSDLFGQKLSADIVILHKDTEQKDKILSAMLRKLKLDTEEKQMLFKDSKLSKVKKKQAEMKTLGWKTVSESRHGKQSLRSLMSYQTISNSSAQEVHSNARAVMDYDQPDIINELDAMSPFTVTGQGNEQLGRTDDMKLLDSLVRSEAVKHVTVLQQRHHLEIEAYLEQMRLKDEKLEALQWQLLSAEFETKRLESNIERLNKEILHLRHGHMSMEPLLLDRGGELSSFKGQCASQLISQDYKNINNHNCSTRQEQAVFDENRRCSQVKVVDSEAAEVAEEEEEVETQIALSETAKEEEIQKEETLSVRNVDSMILLVQSPENEFEEKEVTNQSPYEEENMIVSPGQHSSRTNNSELRMDLHALGVSYKIKRLKQQLSMLERLIGKQQSDYEKGSGSETELFGTEHFHLVMCLNKQVGRYHSLQSKIDDLCQRMMENNVDVNCKARSGKGKTKALEKYLDETFQLQRYIVSTGQRLMEIQTKIASEFRGVADELESFDMKGFGDCMKTLLQQVQRGLEVRTARIIGDLGGTLACQGIIHLQTF